MEREREFERGRYRQNNPRDYRRDEPRRTGARYGEDAFDEEPYGPSTQRRGADMDHWGYQISDRDEGSRESMRRSRGEDRYMQDRTRDRDFRDENRRSNMGYGRGPGMEGNDDSFYNGDYGYPRGDFNQGERQSYRSRQGMSSDYASSTRSRPYGFEADTDYETASGYDGGEQEGVSSGRFSGRGDGSSFYEPAPVLNSGTPWTTEGPYAGDGPKGYQRSKERLSEEVCERLKWSGNLDASNIEVKVENDEVTLEGTVDSRRSKCLAEDIVESVRGIRDIHNRLRIRQADEEQQSPEQQSRSSSSQGTTSKKGSSS